MRHDGRVPELPEVEALAQFLRKKQWSRVLVLEGPEADDTRTSAAFQRAAAKYGLRIVEARHFVSTNDPRQRDLSNPVLLTTGTAYDVVFVADTIGDFARTVPYQVRDPRPVVGATGLVPDAWFFAWERQGAPQLTLRFLARAWSLRQAATKRSSSKGVNSMSGSWLPMKFSPKSASLRATAASTSLAPASNTLTRIFG